MSSAGSGYVLTASLVSPATGELLTSERVTARSEDDVIDAIDELSKGLRERVGESLRTIRAEEPLDQVTTSDLEALRLYTEGAMLVDDIPISNLVAPLAVIDIKSKAAADPNATVDPADIQAYESRYGRIPDGALVAMNSGWSDLVGDGDVFRGGEGFPDLNFPGFSSDATDFLIARRDIVGIGVDTMSIDPGNSQDFAVHFSFLPTNRYGIENLANLDLVPAKGARAVVGAIPWEDGSGGPCRVLALT